MVTFLSLDSYWVTKHLWTEILCSHKSLTPKFLLTNFWFTDCRMACYFLEKLQNWQNNATENCCGVEVVLMCVLTHKRPLWWADDRCGIVTFSAGSIGVYTITAPTIACVWVSKLCYWAAAVWLLPTGRRNFIDVIQKRLQRMDNSSYCSAILYLS